MTSALPRLMGRRKPGSVLCLGKAAFSMARGAASLYPSARGMAYGTASCGGPPAGWQALVGSHPLPADENLANTAVVLKWVAGERDRLLVLVSGGTSALLIDPIPPWDLDEKIRLSSRLLGSGASIAEVNAVRMRLSRVKCGGLRRRCPAAEVLTGIWSDVSRHDHALVGSAPSILITTPHEAEAVLAKYEIEPAMPIPRAEVAHHSACGDSSLLICDSTDLRRSIRSTLTSMGVRVKTIPLPEGFPARKMASHMAQAAARTIPGHRYAFLATGEVSICMRDGGRGGRCSHLAALVSLAMSGWKSWEFVAMATDGVDGTGGAGADIRSDKLPPRRQIEVALEGFDTASLWDRWGLSLPRSPTGNNLRDVYLLVLDRRRS